MPPTDLRTPSPRRRDPARDRAARRRALAERRRVRRRRRIAATAGLAVLALVAVVLLSGGDDGPGDRRAGDRGPGSTLAFAERLSSDMARPWPDVQRDNGHYRSAIGGGTRYGDALLGYTLVESGLRTGDRRLVRSGLRGLNLSFGRTHLHSRTSVFETLAFASAYNLARRRLADEPLFAQRRGQWEEVLRRVPMEKLPATTYYGNHWLIEAVAVRELLRTGLRSREEHAVLGGQREEADRLSADLINRRIPAMARREGVTVGGRRAFVLSDPPDNPLAYQGLSLGFYARGVRLLGERAAPAAKRTLLAVATASTWIAGPDGDLAYYGRNQEEAWALAGTAYGAEVAATMPGSSPADDARLRGLADRALRRLRTAHGIGHFGLNITPGVAAARRAGARGVDPGAGGPSFAGLTLLLADWALPELRAAPRRPAPIPADRDGGAVLARGEGRVAVVRRGDVWFAVRAAPSGKHPDELRSDFGLVAMKVRGRDGAWRDVLRLRPYTKGKPDGAGPLLRSAPVTGFPYGERVRVARDGTVSIAGGFREPPSTFTRPVARLEHGGRVNAFDFTPGRVVRAGVTFRFRPVACGVRIEFPTRPGDRFEHSAFLREERRRPRIGARAVADSRLRMALSHPGRTALEHGYSSGLDPKLLRARTVFSPATGRPINITLCGR